MSENQLKDGKYEFVFESVRVIIQIDTIINTFIEKEIGWKVIEIWMKESEK